MHFVSRVKFHLGDGTLKEEVWEDEEEETEDRIKMGDINNIRALNSENQVIFTHWCAGAGLQFGIFLADPESVFPRNGRIWIQSPKKT